MHHPTFEGEKQFVSCTPVALIHVLLQERHKLSVAYAWCAKCVELDLIFWIPTVGWQLTGSLQGKQLAANTAACGQQQTRQQSQQGRRGCSECLQEQCRFCTFCSSTIDKRFHRVCCGWPSVACCCMLKREVVFRQVSCSCRQTMRCRHNFN
jgi:hypothetical protein